MLSWCSVLFCLATADGADAAEDVDADADPDGDPITHDHDDDET